MSYRSAVVATGGPSLLLALLLSCYRLDTRALDGRIELLETFGSDVILAGYGAFEARAQGLSGAARSFCDAPDDARLAAVREAWSAARGAWKRMDPFAFGPYSDVEYGRFGFQIDFWPARPDVIGELLGGTQALTAEALPALGAAVRGLPALEVVLFADGAETLGKFESVPRRCEYVRAAAADLVILAGQMTGAWDPAQGGFLLQLTYPGENGSMYMGPQEALAEVVNRVGFTLENLRAEKLGAPLGLKTGQLDPNGVESRFSGRSLADIRDALDGIEVILEGASDGAGLGLQDYLRARGRGDNESLIRLRLAEARAAVVAVPEPLSTAVVEAPERVQAAIDALGVLQRLIQTDVIGALSLSLAFNDADGD